MTFLFQITFTYFTAMTYLEFCLESVKYKMIKTKSTRAFEIKIGSLKSFIYNPVDIPCETISSSDSNINLANTSSSHHVFYATRDIEQVMFLTSSECDSLTCENYTLLYV